MNALFKLQTTAGQKRHEEIYGAILKFSDATEIPCTHSEVAGGFDLNPGGLSPRLTIAHVIFRAELAPFTPQKGYRVSLKPANADSWIELKLDGGGLLSDGLNYSFAAVDKDFGA